MVSYTRWVLERARDSGIHKLYFLARDACMPYVVAQRMAKEEGIPVECRYLEGSRYAWRMAEFHLEDTDIIGRICTGGIHVTLRTVCRRGGLSNEEAEQIGRILGKEQELDVQLNYADTAALCRQLRGCRELERRIRDHAGQAYVRTMAYLEQEGLLSGEQFALVDSGWTGTLQMTLEHLLCSRKPSLAGTVRGFYFGLYELPEKADPQRYRTFYFRPYRDIRRKVHFSNCLFEAVCSAPGGMVAGYREAGGKTVPFYESAENPNAGRIRRNLDALERVLEQCYGSRRQDDIRRYIRTDAGIERLLSGHMSAPPEREAEIMGSYLFSDDVLSGSMQPVAAALSREEIRNTHVIRRFLIMEGLLSGSIKESAWLEGSIAKAGGDAFERWNCRAYKRLVYLRKGIRRRLGK